MISNSTKEDQLNSSKIFHYDFYHVVKFQRIKKIIKLNLKNVVVSKKAKGQYFLHTFSPPLFLLS